VVEHFIVSQNIEQYNTMAVGNRSLRFPFACLYFAPTSVKRLYGFFKNFGVSFTRTAIVVQGLSLLSLGSSRAVELT